MKITTDYLIGNTAIQIVRTGKKIKVVDVEKEQKKRYFAKVVFITLFSSVFFLLSCFYIVNLQSTSTVLEKENYRLKSEIGELENENMALAREAESIMVDYKELYKKAMDMGMQFPSDKQVYEYDVEKSTAVRINPVSKK